MVSPTLFAQSTQKYSDPRWTLTPEDQMVHGPYEDFIQFGVTYSLNKQRYVAAVQAIGDLNSKLAEKDKQIMLRQDQLFIVDQEFERYREAYKVMKLSYDSCENDKDKMRPWVSIGKGAVITIGAAALITGAVVVRNQFYQ